jgi:xanthine dehydrogenase YagS FAD-binding subunit
MTMLPKFSYVRPSTIDQALEALGRKGARVHGGGTDLIGCLRDGVFTTDTVVSLSALDELRGVRAAADGGLVIGALTTVAEVAADETVASRFRALADAAAAVASPQLRNQGTLAGNLCQKPRCWYYRGDFHCLRKGGEKCFAYEGALLHRPPLRQRPGAGRPGRGVPHQRSRRQPLGGGREPARAAVRGPAARDCARARRDHH